MKAVEDHSVHPLSVVLHLHHGAVKSIAQQLNHDVRARKSTVNANESMVAPTYDLLGLWPRKTCLRRQLQEPSLQPGMAAASDLVPFEHLNESNETCSTTSTQLNDTAVQEVLAGQAVAQRTIDCRGEPFGRLSGGEVNDRAGCRDRWHAIGDGGVEANDVATPMHHVTDAGH